MVARYLVIIAGCFFVQVLEAKALNGSDSKNVSNDAYEALTKLGNETAYLNLRWYMVMELLNYPFEVYAPNYKRTVDITLTLAEYNLTELQGEAQEKKIEIAECLDGKLDKIRALGLHLINVTEQCAVSRFVNYTRETMYEKIQSVIDDSKDLSIDISQCKENGECFNQIAERAKSLLASCVNLSTEIPEIVNTYFVKWRSDNRYCYPQLEIKYKEKVEEILEAARNCVNRKVASKI